ncbi:MAG: hemin uptake protein HemP [Sulfuritalea sp.]|nr:hemin uptake protein HemP [Sulfuritalea sp.]
MNTDTFIPEMPNEKQRASASAPRPLDSTALLGSKDEVEIIHQGETYRLRRTRQGKLILTK